MLFYKRIRKSKINSVNQRIRKESLYEEKNVQVVTKFGGTIAAFAVMVAAFTANSAYLWLTHQPKEPDEIKQLKK